MKHDLYMKAYIKEISQFIEAVNAGETPDTSPIVRKMVHYGVKAVITAPEPTNRLNNANDNFTFANGVKELMATLTPDEFMTLFPIEKDYKGHRWGFKDYFYTKDYMATLEPDTPIGDEILELLWEYHNWDITLFNIRLMNYLDDMRRLRGKPDVKDEVMAYGMAESTETPNTRPKRHFKVIKGGKA